MKQTGLGVFSLSVILTIVFVVLKLYGVIIWEWWLACLPVMTSVAFVICIVLFLIFLAVIALSTSTK